MAKLTNLSNLAAYLGVQLSRRRPQFHVTARLWGVDELVPRIYCCIPISSDTSYMRRLQLQPSECRLLHVRTQHCAAGHTLRFFGKY
jgi:hypothetical protein